MSEAPITLADCLAEIRNALNYWYPIPCEASAEERDARHKRLFNFRWKLEAQLLENAAPDQQPNKGVKREDTDGNRW